jgi:transcriptional regulator with XRE-family HTH domain
MDKGTKKQQLGDYVRQARAAQGLSIRALAAAAAVDATWLSRLERGDYTKPDPHHLGTLARTLAVPLRDLYSLAGYDNPSDLPEFPVYLRSKYGTRLPEQALAQLDEYRQFLFDKYGVDRSGQEVNDE